MVAVGVILSCSLKFVGSGHYFGMDQQGRYFFAFVLVILMLQPVWWKESTVRILTEMI